MRRFLHLVLLAVPGLSAAEAPPTAEQRDFFEKKIRPVLAAKCYDCHSERATKLKGGLKLDSREALLAGGDSGPAIIPGNVDGSLLIKSIRYGDEDLQMPPKEKLADSVIHDFEQWVKMGAPDPRSSAQAVASAKKQIDWNAARKFWSFQPVKKPAAPPVKDTAWPRNDVDRFVLSGLEARGLKPVGDADRQSLIRRASFDLTGLPPTPEEVDAFLADTSAQAFEKVIDRLLASPQYGERWGRHWLDVARYAESAGKERNLPFEAAWRYRDYVIRAFNEDKPYDEFVREQIAGDLLPAKTAAEKIEQTVATGFLCIGPKGLNERNEAQFRMDVVDDQIDATTQAILGLTVACARCHDHKYDPIPSRDYYAIAGFFTSSQTFYGTPGVKGNRQPGRLLVLNDQGEAVVAGGGAKKNKVRAEKAPASTGGTPVMAVQEGRTTGDCRINLAGDPDKLGEAAPRAIPMVFGGAPLKLKTGESGRLQFAEWLSSPQNPLTARVMVNRIWSHLFGRGLAPATENFGTNGEKPTHPELLDYMASRFVEARWSVKRIIKGLMLTRTYQLATTESPAHAQIDPDNLYLWRFTPRRLDAEAIHDAILAVSGNLNLKPMSGSLAMDAAAAADDKPKGGNMGLRREFEEIENTRRAVYFPIIRDRLPEVLDLFDFAEPSLVQGTREATNVATQALFLMNSPFILEQSAAFAARLEKLGPKQDEGRIAAAYRLALGRPASATESSRAMNYIKSTSAAKAWPSFCQALLASAEFRYLK